MANTNTAIPNSIPIVCIATGDLYGLADTYINRMYSMLKRHCSLPFVLTCYSDRARKVPEAIKIQDYSSWMQPHESEVHPTYYKLGLFDAAKVPFEEFLYLDLTLVIRRDMSSLLKSAFKAEQDLVIVDDWSYPCYNSSVMRIRRGSLQTIYDSYMKGTRYPQHNDTDQDFIYAHIASENLQEHITFFTPQQIVSFKRTLSLWVTDPQAAQRAIQEATIVKFHGEPKMHQIANPLYEWRNLKYAMFFRSELYRNWR